MTFVSAESALSGAELKSFPLSAGKGGGCRGILGGLQLVCLSSAMRCRLTTDVLTNVNSLSSELKEAVFDVSDFVT